MRRNIIAGIDVGTYETKVVLVEYAKDGSVNIVGTGKSMTDGMYMGCIIKENLVRDSIKRALAQAEKIANFKIKKAYLSCGGISMLGEISSGYTIISKADQEITDLDIKNVINQSEENLNLQNKKIIYNTPIGYKIDGKEIYGSPVGMKGAKLDSKIIFITINKKHLDNLISASVEAGLDILDVYPNILSEANIVLSEKQKMAGSAILNIGEDTTTLAVFENNNLIQLQVYPIGGKDIRSDIALYFKISLEEAESLKIGTVLGDYPIKQINEIIEARLGDIFESVDHSLKRIKRNKLLPAGIVITGGGANIQNIEQIAKNYLEISAQVASKEKVTNLKTKVRDESWYTALSLLIQDINTNTKNKNDNAKNSYNSKEEISGFWKTIKDFITQFLP